MAVSTAHPQGPALPAQRALAPVLFSAGRWGVRSATQAATPGDSSRVPSRGLSVGGVVLSQYYLDICLVTLMKVNA